MTRRGCLITLEGIEGVGKSTNIKLIKQLLEHAGLPVVTTREPGGTPVAEAIRHILVSQHSETVLPETELLLLFAARYQHVQQIIKPALRQGQWIICDRFTDASYAYQGGGRGLAKRHIESLETWLLNKLRPDLTLILDAPVKTALRRARNRAKLDRFEKETVQFFERARKVYLARAAHWPGRYRVIDASKSPRYVQQQITQVIQQFLQRKKG